jgi:hypothetical protein
MTVRYRDEAHSYSVFQRLENSISSHIAVPKAFGHTARRLIAGRPMPSSPSVRRLAAGMDVKKVQGTGQKKPRQIAARGLLYSPCVEKSCRRI